MRSRWTTLTAILMVAALPLVMAQGGDRPSKEEIARLQTVKLEMKIEYDEFDLTWTPKNAPPSGGVKVVVSTETKEPLCPYEDYVEWLEGTDHGWCRLQLGEVAGDKVHYRRDGQPAHPRPRAVLVDVKTLANAGDQIVHRPVDAQRTGAVKVFGFLAIDGGLPLADRRIDLAARRVQLPAEHERHLSRRERQVPLVQHADG